MEALLSINRIEVGWGFEVGISIEFLATIFGRVTYIFVKKELVRRDSIFRISLGCI